MRITLYNDRGLCAELDDGSGRIKGVRFGYGNLSYKEPVNEYHARDAEAIARPIARTDRAARPVVA
jgi:hypothetical protein